MSQSTPTSRFATRAGVPLLAAFDGGRLTSDGGLPWLAEADTALALCATLAHCIPDWRRRRGQHSLERLVRQRVYQIACGYEDQNDADTLRHDPLLKLVCGRHGPPSQVLIDVDGTDDPAHGDQEGVAYHGFYQQHMYHPLLVFDGDTGQLITAVLRPGNTHGSRFLVLVLRRLVRRLRRAWSNVAIELRSDSGCAIPRLYAWCEAHAITYTIGLIPNPRLEAWAAPLLADAQAQSAAHDGVKVRLADEADYQAGSWSAPRRVVFKAEVLAKGPNTRFVVTTRPDPPLDLYDFYVDRGQAENYIKDFKNALAADRLSDHRFFANQFRLLLHAAAYWLLDTLRRWLTHTEAARYQFDTLRLRLLKILLKIGGRVWERRGWVRLALATSHPGEVLWHHLAARRGRS